MRKRVIFVILILIYSFFCVTPAIAYKILYAEQFYKLFHRHLTMYPDDIMENIVWLEQALKADFVNPLYALAKINDQSEWRHYKYLFKMHVNLKMVEMYRLLGSRYEKRVAYFYNAPWKKQNLESLKIAEKMYNIALFYWGEAVSWVKGLSSSPHHLDELEQWENEKARMQSGDLDYNDIIREQLAHLQNTRTTFENMDEHTY